MSNVKDLKNQVKELDARIQNLQMQRELLLASISYNEKNIPEVVEHYASAVDYGYLGNYSYIGAYYGTGEDGVPVDLDKAKHYLQKFYDDYKHSRLVNVSSSSVVNAIYNLALIESYICTRNEIKHSTKVINRMKRLFVELIGIAECAGDEIEELALEDVYKAGLFLYSGKFEATDGETITFKPDIKIGEKGLKLAAELGNEDAKSFIEEEGLG